MDTKDRKQRPKSAAGGGRRAAVKTPQRKTPVRRSKPVNTDIVYTQPRPFNRNRFLLRLVTVIAVVLALTFGMAIFFKVENITVSGAEKYTAWEIREASGIQEGENLLTLSDARIGGRITTLLPYVKQARVGIKLPDTVNIEIVELDVVYAAQAKDNSWWLITADGKIVESINGTDAKAYTQILGVKLQAPQVGQAAVAAEPEPETVESSTSASGETQVATVPVTVRAGEQLSMAVSIMQYLEDNGILGELDSIDVTNLNDLELWYGQRFQVILGDSTQLGYKISSMKAVIDSPEIGEYSSGILDISYTTWPDSVGYTPFP